MEDFRGKLPPMSKIIVDPGRQQDNPQAIGYVTTEDADDNGQLDTIHISSPRLEEALRTSGVPLNGIQNINQLSNEELVRLLTPFVELISHELGHVDDYDPEQENVFPGGESAAESAARSAVQQISLGTTNIPNKLVKMETVNMRKQTIEILADLAAKLDEKGAYKVADYIDRHDSKICGITSSRV